MQFKKTLLLLCAVMIRSSSSAFSLPKSSLQSPSFFPFSITPDQWSEIQQEKGKEIVLQVSATLPNFDSVGHNILSANHDFIQTILRDEHLSHATKKSIILLSIKLSQYGDDMGSYILQQYYNLVDACL